MIEDNIKTFIHTHGEGHFTADSIEGENILIDGGTSKLSKRQREMVKYLIDAGEYINNKKDLEN